MSRKIKVGVLRGGPSPEYEVSLKTGSNVLRNLPSSYEPVDVFIDRSGLWHRGGIAQPSHRIAQAVDVFFNALHGPYGEDGKVQQLLESFKKPYTGSAVLPSSYSAHKHVAKRLFNTHGLLTPRGRVIEQGDDPERVAKDIFKTLLPPWIIKPTSLGSSHDVFVARSVNDVRRILDTLLKTHEKVIVEEFIKGRETTCFVIEGGAGARHTMPSIEIKKNKEVWDYDAKYDGSIDEVCPGEFSHEELWNIQNTARRAHEVLGLRDYSRADIIVTPHGRTYVLEVNSLPGLTNESLVHKALSATETTFPEFLDHLVKRALLR